MKYFVIVHDTSRHVSWMLVERFMNTHELPGALTTFYETFHEIFPDHTMV